MFAFLTNSAVSMLFFREHSWGNLGSAAGQFGRHRRLVLGKVVPSLRHPIDADQRSAVRRTVASSGSVPNGLITALVIVVTVLSAVLVAFGVMLVAVFSTMDLARSIVISGHVMAGLGGPWRR